MELGDIKRPLSWGEVRHRVPLTSRFTGHDGLEVAEQQGAYRVFVGRTPVGATRLVDDLGPGVACRLGHGEERFPNLTLAVAQRAGQVRPRLGEIPDEDCLALPNEPLGLRGEVLCVPWLDALGGELPVALPRSHDR